MKKIIVAVPYLSGKGGTETVINNLHEAIEKEKGLNKWDWKLVSFGGTKFDLWMAKWEKTVYHFTNFRFFQRIFYITILPLLILRTLAKERPAFFIATNPLIWTIAFVEKKLFRFHLKIVAWYHYSYKKKNVNRRYLKTADYFWAISSGIKEELLALGVQASKIKLIYNPVDMESVHNIKRSGLQNHFIYIGRVDFDEQKNVSELFRALKLTSGKWNLDIYGDVEVNTRQRLDELTKKIAGNNCIQYHGFQENVWDNIDEADVLFLTSKYEGLPMILIEVASRGVTLVSADCPNGPSDIITFSNGCLYKPGCYKKLGGIIDDIINFRYVLPSSEQVASSVTRFGYQSYILRVYGYLDKM